MCSPWREAVRLKELLLGWMQVEKQMAATPEAGAESVDDKSVYVGQVDYEATPEELQALFQSCGTIQRVTILCDKRTGQSKG